MKEAAPSDHAPTAPFGRRPKIRAYVPCDDGSTIPFEVEWSGYLQRWVIVDAFNGALIDLHRGAAASDSADGSQERP